MAEKRKGPRKGGQYVDDGSGNVRRLDKSESPPKSQKKSSSKTKPAEPKPEASDTAE